MGSLVAILSRSGPPDASAAARMLSAAPHRGDNHVVRTNQQVVLGVSNGGDDVVNSVLSTAGSVTSAFAGTLDNAVELHRDLARAGFPPASPNAADILVAAFHAFGPDAPNRLRGVFAAVVTDGTRIWAFRDHLGFQPLFYSNRPDAFFAATEAKQVIAGARLTREPDLETLEQIFYGALRPDTPSPFKGVQRLPHATTVTVNGDGISPARPYWHPRRLVETGKFRSYEEVKERFDQLFQQAVTRCLTGSDVVALSGGVDSPAVAAYAATPSRESTGEPLAALSLVFPHHPRVDERAYIELITKALDLRLHTFVPQARIFNELCKWSELLDGPIPFMSAPQLNEFYLEARRLGFRNVLTGDIAECLIELQRHLPGHLLTRGRWVALVRLMETQRQQGASLRKLASWKKFAQQLLNPFIPGRLAGWYLSARGLDFPERVPDWLDSRKVNEVPYRNDLGTSSPWNRWSALQTMPLEGCPITMEGIEICSAVSQVAVRRPFADIDLWEFFLSLPAEIKFPDLKSKTLLRRVLRGRVPDEVLGRRDKTFFDDHVMSQIDYGILRRLLTKPEYRLKGVDYERLAERIDAQNLTLIDFKWLVDLVRIHAFMQRC